MGSQEGFLYFAQMIDFEKIDEGSLLIYQVVGLSVYLNIPIIVFLLLACFKDFVGQAGSRMALVLSFFIVFGDCHMYLIHSMCFNLGLAYIMGMLVASGLLLMECMIVTRGQRFYDIFLRNFDSHLNNKFHVLFIYFYLFLLKNKKSHKTTQQVGNMYASLVHISSVKLVLYFYYLRA